MNKAHDDGLLSQVQRAELAWDDAHARAVTLYGINAPEFEKLRNELYQQFLIERRIVV